MDELEVATREDLRHAFVRVLVDDDHPQARMVLALERVEKTPERSRPAYRRDDEVERRGLARHGP
jgi:hypothetical protein